MGGGAGLGGVDEEYLVDVGEELEGFVAEGEVADEGMVEGLNAGQVSQIADALEAAVRAELA